MSWNDSSMIEHFSTDTKLTVYPPTSTISPLKVAKCSQTQIFLKHQPGNGGSVVDHLCRLPGGDCLLAPPRVLLHCRGRLTHKPLDFRIDF